MKKILTVSLFAIMAVSAANAEIASTKYVGDQITATAGTLSSLQTKVTDNLVAAINSVKADVDGVSAESGDFKSDLEQSISDLSDAVDTKFGNYTTTTDMNSAIAAAKSGAETTAANALATYKSTNDTAVQKAQADATQALSDATTKSVQALTDAKAYTDTLANGQVKTNKEAIAAMDEAYKAADAATLNSAKSYADDLAGNYDAQGSAAQALTDAKAYTDTLANGQVKTNKEAIAAMDTAYKAADTALGGRVTTAEGNITTLQSDVAGLKSGDNSVAKQIETALTGYSTTTQMNSAIASADTALETKVTNAYEAADAALETSLKSYADTAEADAIAAAATDATTKANAAEAAAKAASDSKGSAEQALADAKQFTTEQIEALGKLATVDTACASGVTDCALVIRSGEIKWEKVSY